MYSRLGVSFLSEESCKNDGTREPWDRVFSAKRRFGDRNSNQRIGLNLRQFESIRNPDMRTRANDV